jgi:hypothetical protein
VNLNAGLRGKTSRLATSMRGSLLVQRSPVTWSSRQSPEAWGPKLRTYRYVYGDDRIFFVDPANRRVIQVIE